MYEIAVLLLNPFNSLDDWQFHQNKKKSELKQSFNVSFDIFSNI